MQAYNEVGKGQSTSSSNSSSGILWAGSDEMPYEEGSNTNYGSQIEVSDQKMYQRGDQFNKHGRDMGYTGKKDYEAGARKFIEDNRNTADIFEGVWNSSRRGQSGQT